MCNPLSEESIKINKLTVAYLGHTNLCGILYPTTLLEFDAHSVSNISQHLKQVS